MNLLVLYGGGGYNNNCSNKCSRLYNNCTNYIYITLVYCDVISVYRTCINSHLKNSATHAQTACYYMYTTVELKCVHKRALCC